MNYYYALFTKSKKAVEVVFPDLEGCVTFGRDWEEALENAKDALAGWLAHAEPQFIASPSKHNELEHLSGTLIPIPIDQKTLASYQEVKRFNVIFPVQILKKVDHYRKCHGLKRSTLLQRAVEEYISRYSDE